MTTVAKSLGEFEGAEDENIDIWIEQAEVTCRMFEFQENDNIKVVLVVL